MWHKFGDTRENAERDPFLDIVLILAGLLILVLLLA
jgi:hypothetical protein